MKAPGLGSGSRSTSWEGALVSLLFASACGPQVPAQAASVGANTEPSGLANTPPASAPAGERTVSVARSANVGEPASTAAASPANTPAPATTLAAGSTARAKTTEGITRTLLDQSELAELPGWETRLFLIEYAPGVAAPVHHHPAPGVGYVLSGSFQSTFEGEKMTEVREGQSFRDLPNVAHVLFKNASSTQPLKFVISYVVRKGAPVLVVP